MALRGRSQIRVQAERVEHGVGREARRGFGVVERGGMDAPDRAGDGNRDVGIDVAGEQRVLPDEVVFGRKKLHDGDAVGAVFAEDARHGTGYDFGGLTEPGDLIAVALNRHAPVVGDHQLGERALGAEITARGEMDAHDVRRDASGQGIDLEGVGIGDAHVIQNGRQQRPPRILASHHRNSARNPRGTR